MFVLPLIPRERGREREREREGEEREREREREREVRLVILSMKFVKQLINSDHFTQQVNTALRELHLSKHGMTDTGVEWICRMLKENQTLTVLDLSW